MPPLPSVLPSLADHLRARREALLEEWHRLGMADPAQPTANSLTRAQFFDHIPQFLDALEARLRSRSVGPPSESAHAEEVKHGLQRWQQGYALEELMREWGNLHACLLAEIGGFARRCPHWSPDLQWEVAREVATLIHEGVAESAAQYSRLERDDAAGRLRDLEKVVISLRELEGRRVRLIHEAVHDLRGNVQSVSNVAELLGVDELPEAERADYAHLLQKNIDTVASMIQDLMELARLESGKERRSLGRFDAARMITEHCALHAGRAQAKGLYLRTDGPARLPVVDDANKIRRLLQNLLVNALKYTEQGGVTVTWGLEEKRWWIRIQDTGPGLLGGPGAPLVRDLRDATISAREADENGAAEERRESSVLDQAEIGPPVPASFRRQMPGEGIGLSIVKRLCELLDATIELVSSGGNGTIIRVAFPRRDDLPVGEED